MHVGRIAAIISGAVRDAAHELREWGSDVFDARESADRARRHF